MLKNEELIHKFYNAFGDCDVEGMAECYHEDIVFEDPVFGKLQGEDVMHMWRMLVHRGKPELEISVSNIRTMLNTGDAHWEAIYPFSKTGRKVHNHIDAKFVFKGDKIVNHVDQFNLHHWAAMALGWKGRLFGGMSFFQNKIKKSARKSLDKWKEKQV